VKQKGLFLILALLLVVAAITGCGEGLAPTPKYNLAVSINPANSGTVSPGGGSYDSGSQVTLTAMANSHYVFSGWTGSISGTSNPITFTMDSDKTVVANFVYIKYNLTINTPQGQGTITEQLKVTGSSSYNEGAVVEVTANPAEGWKLDHWTGDLSGSTNPQDITMDSDKTISAVFTQITTHTGTWHGGWSIPGLSLTGNLTITIAFDGTLSGTIFRDIDGSSTSISGISDETTFNFTYQFMGSSLCMVNGTIVKYNDELIGSFTNQIQGGSSYQGTFDINNPTVANSNLVLNGDIETDNLCSWFPWANSPGEKPSSTRVSGINGFSGYCLKFGSTNCGTNEWHCGLGNYCNFIIKAGKTYTLSLKAKSDKPGKFIYMIQNTSSSSIYEHYYYTSIYTTTTPTEYIRSFTSTVDDPNCTFGMDFGNTSGDNNNDGTNFYIDDVQLIEQTAVPTAPSGDNLQLDSDFETDIAGIWGWWYYSSTAASPTVERVTGVPGVIGFSGYYLHFKSVNCGTANWNEVISGTPFTLQPGKTYTVAFKACSSNNARIHFQIGYIDIGYYEFGVNTSTTTQNYNCQFIFNGPSSRNVKFFIFFGNYGTITINNNVDFYVDDVQVLEQ
jgi:uncharacterized repeat protein (TIGR02543 family)